MSQVVCIYNEDAAEIFNVINEVIRKLSTRGVEILCIASHLRTLLDFLSFNAELLSMVVQET